MPPFRSTGYVLSNVLGGIIGAQSPQGQLARARVATEEDELQQTKRTREFLKDFKWDQPNAAENALRGLAAIDPAFSSPLINLTYEKGLRAIREDRQRKFAEEYRSFAPGGISDEELARSQATRAEYGLDDVRERDPLRFLPYEYQLRGRVITAGGGESRETTWLKHDEQLAKLGYNEEQREAARKEYKKTGWYDVTKLGEPTTRVLAEPAIKRLENRIFYSKELKDIAAKPGISLKVNRWKGREAEQQRIRRQSEEILTQMATGQEPVPEGLFKTVRNYAEQAGYDTMPKLEYIYEGTTFIFDSPEQVAITEGIPDDVKTQIIRKYYGD